MGGGYRQPVDYACSWQVEWEKRYAAERKGSERGKKKRKRTNSRVCQICKQMLRCRDRSLDRPLALGRPCDEVPAVLLMAASEEAIGKMRGKDRRLGVWQSLFPLVTRVVYLAEGRSFSVAASELGRMQRQILTHSRRADAGVVVNTNSAHVNDLTVPDPNCCR